MFQSGLKGSPPPSLLVLIVLLAGFSCAFSELKPSGFLEPKDFSVAISSLDASLQPTLRQSRSPSNAIPFATSVKLWKTAPPSPFASRGVSSGPAAHRQSMKSKFKTFLPRGQSSLNSFRQRTLPNAPKASVGTLSGTYKKLPLSMAPKVPRRMQPKLNKKPSISIYKPLTLRPNINTKPRISPALKASLSTMRKKFNMKPLISPALKVTPSRLRPNFNMKPLISPALKVTPSRLRPNFNMKPLISPALKVTPSRLRPNFNMKPLISPALKVTPSQLRPNFNMKPLISPALKASSPQLRPKFNMKPLTSPALKASSPQLRPKFNMKPLISPALKASSPQLRPKFNMKPLISPALKASSPQLRPKFNMKPLISPALKASSPQLRPKFNMKPLISPALKASSPQLRPKFNMKPLISPALKASSPQLRPKFNMKPLISPALKVTPPQLRPKFNMKPLISPALKASSPQLRPKFNMKPLISPALKVTPPQLRPKFNMKPLISPALKASSPQLRPNFNMKPLISPAPKVPLWAVPKIKTSIPLNISQSQKRIPDHPPNHGPTLKPSRPWANMQDQPGNIYAPLGPSLSTTHTTNLVNEQPRMNSSETAEVLPSPGSLEEDTGQDSLSGLSNNVQVESSTKHLLSKLADKNIFKQDGTKNNHNFSLGNLHLIEQHDIKGNAIIQVIKDHCGAYVSKTLDEFLTCLENSDVKEVQMMKNYGSHLQKALQDMLATGHALPSEMMRAVKFQPFLNGNQVHRKQGSMSTHHEGR